MWWDLIFNNRIAIVFILFSKLNDWVELKFPGLFKDCEDREGVRPDSRGTEISLSCPPSRPFFKKDCIPRPPEAWMKPAGNSKITPAHLTRGQIQDEIGLGVKLRQIWDNYWARIQRENDGFMHDVCLAKKKKKSQKASLNIPEKCGFKSKEERFPADPCTGLQGRQT